MASHNAFQEVQAMADDYDASHEAFGWILLFPEEIDEGIANLSTCQGETFESRCASEVIVDAGSNEYDRYMSQLLNNDHATVPVYGVGENREEEVERNASLVAHDHNYAMENECCVNGVSISEDKRNKWIDDAKQNQEEDEEEIMTDMLGLAFDIIQ